MTFGRTTVRDAVRPAIRSFLVRGRAGGGGAAPLRFAGAAMRSAQSIGNTFTYLATVPVRTLTASGTTATAVVDSTASMAVGGLVSITNATPSAYNGNFAVASIVNGTTFTYTIATSNPGAGSGASCSLPLPLGGGKRFDVQSITSVGTTATVTFTNLDGLTTGDQLFVYGSNAQGYNGLVTITGTNGSTTATYTMSLTASGVASSGHTVIPVKNATVAVEMPLILGSGDWSELEVLLPNWSIGQAYGIEGAQGGVSIDDCSITIGTAYAPVKFSGARTRTILATDAEVVSDAIKTTDFIGGTPTFSRGTTVIIKAKLTRASFSGACACFGGPSPFNANAHVYSYCKTDGSFTIGSTDSASSYAPAGRNNGQGYLQDTNLNPPAFALLGRPVSSVKVFIATGDSITQNVGDDNNTSNDGTTTANIATGRNGWFCRSLWDSSFTASSAYAGMNLSVSGNVATMYTNASPIGTPSSWFTNWMAYATHYVEADGTNGNGGANETASESLWASAKSKGAKVIRTSLWPRTSSTDSWATTANQTPAGGWGVGSTVATQEAQWQGFVGTQVDSYLAFATPRASAGTDRTQANYWLWRVTGAANYSTTDGLHPAPVNHASMSQEARTLWGTVP